MRISDLSASKLAKHFAGCQLTTRLKTGSTMLGKGSFGVVFDVHPGRYVAKISSCNSLCLEKELNVFKRMARHAGLLPFLVKMHQIVSFTSQRRLACKALIMDFAGTDLQTVYRARCQRFPRKVLYDVAYQVVCALEALHTARLVHRDIKPANISMLSSPGSDKLLVRLIDFGLAKNWSSKTVEPRKPRGAGTAKFSGWKQHAGYGGSPGNDLESLIYTLVYLSGIHLEWSGLGKMDKHDQQRKISTLKRFADSTRMCVRLDMFDQSGRPAHVGRSSQNHTNHTIHTNQTNSTRQHNDYLNFADLLDETRTLGLTAMPDYHAVKQLIDIAQCRSGSSQSGQSGQSARSGQSVTTTTS